MGRREVRRFHCADFRGALRLPLVEYAEMKGRILQWVILVAFLAMNIGGFYYTMTKKYPPIIPWRVSRFSYGMMAPWQSYTMTNTELVAQGELPEPGNVPAPGVRAPEKRRMCEESSASPRPARSVGEVGA